MSATDRTDRRRTYRAIIDIVDGNTGDPQPAGVRPVTIKTVASHGETDPGDVASALRAALENGDLVRWRDADGDWRYALADADYEAGDEAALREVARMAGERGDQSLAAWANHRLAELGGGGGEV